MGSNLKLLRSPAGRELLLHPRRQGPATEPIERVVSFARRRTLRPRGAGLRQLAAFSGERSLLPSTYRSRYSIHEPHLRVQLQEPRAERGHLARQLHALRSEILRPGAENPATSRQPIRHEAVTHVLGTYRDPCLRAGIESLGAGEGNRTLVFSLEGCCSTIELHPQQGLPNTAGRRSQLPINCPIDCFPAPSRSCEQLLVPPDPPPLNNTGIAAYIDVFRNQRKEVIQCLLPSAITSLGSPAKL